MSQVLTIPAVTLVRTYPVARERIFAAWTDPALMAQWFFPGPGFTSVTQNEPRAGGSYRITYTSPTGQVNTAHGIYQEFDPPAKLVFTWAWEENPSADGSVVTIELRELDLATRLTLTHERVADEQARQHHANGWIGALHNLHLYLDPASAPAAPAVPMM